MAKREKGLTLDDIRASYSAFFAAMNPSFVYARFQHEKVIPVLERIAALDPLYNRTAIEMPFQNGKTTIATTNFIPFYFGHHPDHNVILLSYGKKLSLKFGRAIRDLMQKSDLYARLFPDAMIKKTSRASGEFETVSGGAFFAGGFKDGVSGRGSSLLVIDDPCKSREEALSETVREKVRSIYTNTAETRLAPNAAILICTTRWTPDDLVGWRVEEEGGYDVLMRRPYSDTDLLEAGG